jgi:hypothetical protein
MTLRAVAGISVALALGATPALAVKSPPHTNSGTTHRNVHATTPGPSASAGAKAKAYGKYCQGESKLHVSGSKGTPFSQCVNAMAKVAHNHVSGKQACSSESRKKAAGQTKSAYALCVSGAAKLKHDQAASTS